MVALMLAVCEECGGSGFAESRCDGEAARTRADYKDIVDVYFFFVYHFVTEECAFIMEGEACIKIVFKRGVEHTTLMVMPIKVLSQDIMTAGTITNQVLCHNTNYLIQATL